MKYDSDNRKMKNEKARVFVEHVRKHLFEMDINPKDVMCKICNKTIDEIWNLETNKEGYFHLQPGVYKEGDAYVDRNGNTFRLVKSEP